jgi:hypothetical protein
MLVYDVCGAIADVSPLDWVAAIGVLSDVGEKAPFSLLETGELLDAHRVGGQPARFPSRYRPRRWGRLLRARPRSGHRGSLPVERWELLLAKLGF